MENFKRFLTPINNDQSHLHGLGAGNGSNKNGKIGTTPQKLFSSTPLTSTYSTISTSAINPRNDDVALSNTSLVQKLAARFVPTAIDQHTQNDTLDGDITPMSRGGNPRNKRQLFSETLEKPVQKSVNLESHSYQQTHLSPPHKGGQQSVMGVLVLLWLINQREVTRYLSHMRASIVEDQHYLHKTQDTVLDQVVKLGEQISNLQMSVYDQQQQIVKEKDSIKRYLSIFGLIQLVVIVSIFTLPRKPMQDMYKYCSSQIKKSLVKPVASVYRIVRHIPVLLSQEIPDMLDNLMSTIANWR